MEQQIRPQPELDAECPRERQRHQNALELAERQHRLEAVRIAHTTLLENSRSMPIDERRVTAEDIELFAQKLAKFIGG